MAKMSKTMVDKELREGIFFDMFQNNCGMYDYTKVNDRQYGVILTDANGVERYCRVGVIVAEIREDMTAKELMDTEIEEYRMKQEAKAEKAKAKEAKIAKDKARREKEKADAEPDQYLPREVSV
jgi:hypothetical protein